MAGARKCQFAARKHDQDGAGPSMGASVRAARALESADRTPCWRPPWPATSWPQPRAPPPTPTPTAAVRPQVLMNLAQGRARASPLSDASAATATPAPAKIIIHCVTPCVSRARNRAGAATATTLRAAPARPRGANERAGANRDWMYSGGSFARLAGRPSRRPSLPAAAATPESSAATTKHCACCPN